MIEYQPLNDAFGSTWRPTGRVVCPADPHTLSIVNACGQGLLRAINNTLENTSLLPLGFLACYF